MSSSERLSELLLHWRELQQQGKEPAPEEVCADCPELVDELKRRIEAIRAMEAMLGGGDSSSTTAHNDRAHAGPRTLEETAGGRPVDLDSISIPGYDLLG